MTIDEPSLEVLALTAIATKVRNGISPIRVRSFQAANMKIKRAEESGPATPATLCEIRHDVFGASTADYVYGVTMHHGRWVATFHGAGCHAITGYTPEEMERDS